MALRTLFQPTTYPFPILFGSRELEDHALKGSIPLELWLKHEGVELIEKGVVYQVRLSHETSNPYNTLVCSINSYRGISIGAEHWYGKIRLPPIRFYQKGTNVHRLWLSERTLLQEVILHRRLKREEPKLSPERFRANQTNGWCNGFDSVEEVTNRAKNIARFHFPGFKLVQEYEGNRQELSVSSLPIGDTTRKEDTRQIKLF